MKRKWLIPFICTALMIGTTACKKPLTWQEQYDLGVRYLNEGNYQEAIIAFTAAIELDPARMDAYISLVNSYLNIGDYEGADSIIERGKSAVIDTDVFVAMKNIIQFAQEKYYDDSTGKRMDVYYVQTSHYGDCMIYYGDYEDGVRSGNGLWFGFHDGNNYASKGTWTDDAPNGAFEVTEWYSGLNETVTYRIISGNVNDGLWNGNIVWAFDRDNGNYQAWECTFIDGRGQMVEIAGENGATRCLWSTQQIDGTKGGLGPSEGTEDELEGVEGFVPIV